MVIGWPQGIYLVLMLMSLGVAIAKHGEVRPRYHGGGSLIGTGVAIGLLYWGGFFS